MGTLVQLPNGLRIRSLEEKNSVLVYEEVFENEVYFQHGIELDEEAVVFDVGANIGLFLVQLNQRLERGVVFAFEPIPAIFAVLEENAVLHNRLDLRLFNIGLSSSEGSAEFSFFPKSPADSTMHLDDSEIMRIQQRLYILRVLDGEGAIRLGWPARCAMAVTPRFVKRSLAEWLRRRIMASRPVNCPIRTLSAIIDEHGVERIDLLKMDAEGAEFEILAGLRPEHWQRVRQMVLEVHGGQAKADAMLELLKGRGMTVHCDVDPVRENNFMLYARRQPV